MRYLLILLLLITFTGCLFDSDGLEFEDIIGTHTGKTRDTIFYLGSYVEAYNPVTVRISYPDTTNSRLMDIINDDYSLEHALGELLYLEVTETISNVTYTAYEGLIAYDVSNAGSDTLGFESMMYFVYDDMPTGNRLYMGVSKFDSGNSIKVTMWPMTMKGQYPFSEDKPYLDLYEDLR